MITSGRSSRGQYSYSLNSSERNRAVLVLAHRLKNDEAGKRGGDSCDDDVALLSDRVLV